MRISTFECERNAPMQNDLLERVEKLEVQARRWRAGFILLALMTIATLIAGAAPAQQNAFDDDGSIQVPVSKLRTRDFTLVGQDGKPYAHLYTKDNEPVLEFYNRKGELIWSVPPSKAGYQPVSGH